MPDVFLCQAALWEDEMVSSVDDDRRIVYISGIQPRLVMTDAGLDASLSVAAVNQHGEPQQGYIAAERPLTIYLNKRELVTLMTLGTQPELLVLGWPVGSENRQARSNVVSNRHWTPSAGVAQAACSFRCGSPLQAISGLDAYGIYIARSERGTASLPAGLDYCTQCAG